MAAPLPWLKVCVDSSRHPDYLSPISKILETYLLKDIEVKVIDVDEANNRLVLSAREILQEKSKKGKRMLRLPLSKLEAS